MRARLLLTSALVACAAPAAAAQQLAVTVRDSLARTPVAAAIVTATEQATGARVFGLTNDDGRVTLRLPSAGSWAASVRRIGIVPLAAAAVRVDQSVTVPVLLAASTIRFSLPSVRVTANAGVCGRAPTGVDRTSALWEQITLALQSSALTRGDLVQGPRLRVTLRERVLSKDLTVLATRVITEGTGAGRPFFAADPDSLARHGYVRTDHDGMISYFAPDEVVMLSDAFVRTHCFLTPTSDADPALAELEFQPVPRRNVPDVAGVAYVDTTSGELRRIVFRYVNGGRLFPRSATFAGGEVSLRRLDTGQWIVADWAIRMPRVIGAGWRDMGILAGYRETGGSTVTAAEWHADSVTRLGRGSGVDSARRRSEAGTAAGDVARTSTSRDTSIRRFMHATGLDNRPMVFVGARTVEDRTRFRQHAAEVQGVFFDSTAIAGRGAVTLFDLVTGAPGVMSFHVPDDMPGPANDSDAALAAEWRPGANVPMMSVAPARPADTGTRLCFPKLFLDGRVTPLRVAELHQLHAVQIAVMEIYPPNSRVAMASRITGTVEFSGNRCGLIQLRSYVDYQSVQR